MKILVACEESQTITKELRARGHEAYSCDILPCSGGHPEWHIKADVLSILDQGWDMMIAHPPCTYLSVAGAWANYRKDGSIVEERVAKQEDALSFVQQLMDAPIERIAIENPVSIISTRIRKPDQIVHPYHFGNKASKQTCWWLKNLPLLQHTDVVEKGEYKEWICSKTGKLKKQAQWIYDCALKSTRKERAICRSKTFLGMAKAIADQWTKPEFELT